MEGSSLRRSAFVLFVGLGVLCATTAWGDPDGVPAGIATDGGAYWRIDPATKTVSFAPMLVWDRDAGNRSMRLCPGKGFDSARADEVVAELALEPAPMVLYFLETPEEGTGLARLAETAERLDFHVFITAVSDADAARLAGFAKLPPLGLGCGSEFTDAGMAYLPKLGDVQVLATDSEQLTDAGMAHLAGLTRLESLTIMCPHVTEAGLSNLAGLRALEDLYLLSPPVSDAGLRSVAQVRALRRLALDGARVTDAGLEQLSGLAGLEELTLNAPLVTDAGLAHLAKLPRLETLDVTGAKLTAAGVKLLAELPSLRYLGLRDTGLSAAEAKALEAAYPSLQIRP